MKTARYMILHKSNAQSEAGARPDPQLVARVGDLIGELAKSGMLLGGEGLRPTSLGARVRFVKGECTVMDGPFTESKELIAGFAILRVPSLQEAVELSKRFQAVLGVDLEIDIRPLTEAWDIGLGTKPPGLTTTRFMGVHKYLNAADGCQDLSPERAAQMSQFLEELTKAGILLGGEGLEPSAKGAQIKAGPGARPAVLVTDGPFAESKEVLGGFVIVKAAALEEVIPWAERYFSVVPTNEVHVRLVAEGPPPA
jgi:hypothetical protein